MVSNSEATLNLRYCSASCERQGFDDAETEGVTEATYCNPCSGTKGYAVFHNQEALCTLS